MQSPLLIAQVVLDVPLPGPFDYLLTAPCEHRQDLRGRRVLVPWGKQTKIGLIWDTQTQTEQPVNKLKAILAVLDDIPALDTTWRALMSSVAAYYHKPLGEVALQALPVLLRRAEPYRRATGHPPASRSIKLLEKRVQKWLAQPSSPSPSLAKTLNSAQQAALAVVQGALAAGRFQCYLLHGITGSGKTEVYLQALAECLARGQQALLLVPEINLTPQLEATLQARFPQHPIALLHSGRSDGERAVAWLAACRGETALMVGTRLAVLTPCPNLGLIIVDEEHDPSYKQQEGVRYSARDVAILRAQQLGIPIVLGSATPALESWQHSQTGRYHALPLPERAIVAAQLPQIQLIDIRAGKLQHGLSQAALAALAENLTRQQTSLVFMNRRGFAPVLQCQQCGWVSQCRHCSAYSVFHKADGRLHCHHCGWQAIVPKHCPQCGNLDIIPLGYGTQRIEDFLRQHFPAARIIRIDADSTKGKVGAQPLLAQVHAGEADILIGTQMVAKGHDFKNLSLVVALNVDSALFAQDFRAPERLFAQLMQVAGRAGRDGLPSQMLIQTQYTDHPLFNALQQHDYPSFATQQLAERESAQLPPFAYQALFRAEAPNLSDAIAFLQALQQQLAQQALLRVYEPVPLNLVRVAGKERAQLLIEANQRPPLHLALKEALVYLASQKKSRVKWSLDIDPQEI
ncbi:primosomal protein N' [Parvibium lacunae]|uniref:Replication restart protein PriA n=1 Tax=Parvibium lacunae TaxID=1888893 RepID=A0A368KZ56_9BURK|nr:primosomal protein N' [Parvibium lacunae]RCS56653.1 primosomal protein N' [Parvibium lacunae]